MILLDLDVCDFKLTKTLRAENSCGSTPVKSLLKERAFKITITTVRLLLSFQIMNIHNMTRFLLLLVTVFTFFQSFSQNKPQGLSLNATAPDFRATDQNGKNIRLSGLRKKGPVVVVFYRGYWCPYCSQELKKLSDSLQYITAKGASVVAISPQTGDGVDKTVAEAGATFPVLFDKDVKIAKAYDVSYEVEEKTRTQYLEKWNVDFLKINDQKEKAVLPVPAVYIIDKKGKVIYRFFDTDITKRPSVKDLLEHL